MYPTEKLPQPATRVSTPTPRRPLVRRQTLHTDDKHENDEEKQECLQTRDVGVNTDGNDEEMSKLTARVAELEKEVSILRRDSELNHTKFRLQTIVSDDAKVAFYTGFPSYAHLKACFDFLRPATSHLLYRDSKRVLHQSNKGRPRSLSPMDEFFLTLVRLRLGLLEQDIAYRFGVSQSTISRVFTSWINFMYLQFKQISLWPPQEFVDATELFIQQSSLPELQQLTFSNYKNHNTYKGLIYRNLPIWCSNICIQALSWKYIRQRTHTSKWSIRVIRMW